MNTAAEGGPQFYSQVTAAAMHDAIARQRITLRRLWNLVGALNREADQQAATIKQLREEVELWRGRYLRVATSTDDKSPLDT